MEELLQYLTDRATDLGAKYADTNSKKSGRL